MTYPIELKNISKSFPTADSKLGLQILNNINFCLNSNESTAIIGKSGTGKSTLLQICGGLDKPTEGTVLIDGIDISKLNDSKMSELRNKRIGFIFQANMLLEDFTALENVMVPAMIAGKNKTECKKTAEELLKQMGLEDRMNHYPAQLSGGEKQRVAIARALINNPDVILADEPTGSLDEENAKEVEDRLLDVVKSDSRTLLLVTHNMDFAKRCNRILLLKNHTLTEEKIK